MGSISGSMNIQRNSFRWLLAELLVVVLGILIALQVDAWRESRQERAIASNALVGLSSDLALEIQSLEGLIEVSKFRAEAVEGLIGELRSESGASAEKLVQYWVDGIFSYTYSPIATTYIGLRENGQLSLLDDPNLQERLIRYYERGQPYITGWVTTIRNAREDTSTELERDIYRSALAEPVANMQLVYATNSNGEQWSYLVHQPVSEIPGNSQFFAKANKFAFYLDEIPVRLQGPYDALLELKRKVDEKVAMN